MRWMTNPVFISAGDLYNRDFNKQKGIMYFEETLKEFEEIEKITNGRCYIVYGNHEDTYLNISPSVMVMKLSEHLKDIITLNKSSPEYLNRNFGTILKTPREIRIYDSKITLHHFNKYDKEYYDITGDCEYHIKIFHDTFINNTMRGVVPDNLPIDKIWGNSLSNLNLKNVDLALFGDFHIPVPPFKINNRRNTAIVIMGSYGRNNINTETHNHVKLPIIKFRKGKTPEVLITNFPLIDYTKSYNMGDKTKDLSNITNHIRNLVNETKKHKTSEINIENFCKFIYNIYGEEWFGKVYNIIHNVMGVELFINKDLEEENGEDNKIQTRDF